MEEETSSLFDPEVVRRLLQQLERTDIAELEVARGDARIYVKREPGNKGQAGVTQASGESVAETPPVPGIPIPAPLAGVFYSRPSPEDSAFVRVGDVIEVGTIVGLIETMKMYNEVSSELAGEVVAVPVQDGALVDSGQPLVYVRIGDGGGA